MASPSVDLSEFFKYSRPKKRPCPIGFAQEQLTDSEREQLTAALAQDNGIITNAAVQQWLAGRGHDASISAITSHRKGACSCGDS